MRFKFAVTETREVPVFYWVEAESEEEAEGLAGKGETVDEKPDGSSYNVVGREVLFCADFEGDQ